MFEEGQGKKKIKQRAEIRKPEFLAAGEACKQIFWPTPNAKLGIFDSSGLSTEEIVASASAVAPRGTLHEDDHQAL